MLNYLHFLPMFMNMHIFNEYIRKPVYQPETYFAGTITSLRFTHVRNRLPLYLFWAHVQLGALSSGALNTIDETVAVFRIGCVFADECRKSKVAHFDLTLDAVE